MRDLDAIASTQQVIEFFGRIVRTDYTAGSRSLRVLDANGVVTTTARVLGSIMQSGDLIRAVRLIEPSVNVSVETAEAFASIAAATPGGRFATLMEHVTTMRESLDTLPANVLQQVRRPLFASEREFEEAVAKAGPHARTSYTKLLKCLASGALYVGQITVTAVAGYTAYKLLRIHADNASGCYKIETLVGTRCKAVKYSVRKENVVANECNSVHNVKPDKHDWDEHINASCLRACDDDYLQLNSSERSLVTYRCINLDVWDALADIVGHIDPIKYISRPLRVVIVVVIGVVAATAVVRRAKKRKSL